MTTFATTTLTNMQNLAVVDLYRYDEAWELEATEAISWLSEHTAAPKVALIDLRKPDDYAANNISGSYNMPLQSLSSGSPSPFFDAAILERQWNELETMFSPDRIGAYDLSGKNVAVICYTGDTARVATSVLRAKGLSASSIKGGFRAVTTQLPPLQVQARGRTYFQEWSKACGPDVTIRETRADSVSPFAADRT
jgi:rhodanese-related sulfurtransferase